MTASYNESRNFDLERDLLLESAKVALEKSKFKIKAFDKTTGIIRAKTKLSWWSWTEVVTVNINENSELQILSKCAFPMQIFDWGKNKQNVKKFFSNLKE